MEVIMRNICILLLLFTLLFFSCSVTDAPFEHKYVINLVLKPEVKLQKAYVDSTYRLDVPVNDDLTGISGAEIFIVDEDLDTFRYSESDTIGHYYSIDSLWVEHGMTYFVNVAIGNDTITEDVTVPDTLTIYYPFDFDTVSLSNPPMLIWNTCGGCYKNNYVVFAYLTGQADSITYSMATPDTMMGIFYALDLFPDVDTLYTITVMGMDEHCYNSYKGWLSYDEIEDERAIGVIGACVLDSVAVWVIE